MQDPRILIAAAAGFLIGVALLWWARRSDRRNWFIERAPQLPLRLVNPSDDVWVDGTVACDAPIHVPWFDVPCVHYSYTIEKKVQRTRRTSDGKTETYYTWVNEHSDSGSTRFRLVDEDASIEVVTEDAKFDRLESTGTDYETSRRRHSASYFAPGGNAGVVGLVDEEGVTLGRGKNIPLVVTRRQRDDYIRAIESAEAWLRRFGVFFLWLGFSIAFFFFLSGGDNIPVRIAVASLAGLLPLSLIWGIYTYNTFVALRTRTTNAWRLIDIDLKNRYDLVPQLETVIKAACAHEKELLEKIVGLRSGYVEGDVADRVGQEGEASGAVTRFLGLAESYPDLKTNPNYQQLYDTLIALEDKIAHDRHFYNDNATEYRTLVENFPHSIVAQMGKFRAPPLFVHVEGE